MKYASMLTILFVTFKYGFELPVLFLISSFCFTVQFFLDKILLVYWYKSIPLRSDTMIIFSIRIIQFAPVFMFFSAAFSLSHNACMTQNQSKPIDIDNEVVICTDLWWLPKFIYAIASILTSILCLNELRLFIKGKNENRFESFLSENTTFFSRLSNLEKKRWLAEETYNREELGFKLISDSTMREL